MRLTRRQFVGLIAGAGLTGVARTAYGASDTFTFATIGDIHVLGENSTAIVGHAVDKINANPSVQFAVIVGDLAIAGRGTELDYAHQALKRLAKPWFVLPGNHDVNMTAADIYKEYNDRFGKPDWTNEREGWLFLGIDSCNEDKSDVSIRQDQIEWLKQQLDHDVSKRPIALFCHHPFNPHSKAYRVKNAGEVLSLFKDRSLRLVAAGHFHGNQVEERDGVLFTTTACCSSIRGNHDGSTAKGFRLFHVDNTSIKTEFVEVAA